MIKPFWSEEDDYLERYVDFLYDCEHAYNLRDALACGANMTHLNGKQVGYMDEHGHFELYGDFIGKTDEELEKIEVMFDCTDKDLDGYTVAYFNYVGVEK